MKVADNGIIEIAGNGNLIIAAKQRLLAVLSIQCEPLDPLYLVHHKMQHYNIIIIHKKFLRNKKAM